MFFWEQGKKVECSKANKPATTGTSGRQGSSNSVNKYTSYYKPSTTYSYSYTLNTIEKDMKKTEDLLGEFSNWIDRENDSWRSSGGGYQGYSWNQNGYKPWW